MENLGLFLDRVVHSGEVEIVGKICKRGSSCFEDHHDFGESLARVETRHPPSLQSPTHGFVVHCIIRELMPINGSKMHYLLSRNHRMYQASWRRDFKKDWKAARAINLGNTVHTTDVDGWVCSCPGFVQSRFASIWSKPKRSIHQSPRPFSEMSNEEGDHLSGSFQIQRSPMMP